MTALKFLPGGLVALGAVMVSALALAAPQRAPAPACDSYDVELTLRRMFAQSSPRDYGTIVMMGMVRQLSVTGDVRECSAELILNRSWMKSAHVYAVFIVVNTGGGNFGVKLGHMDDL